MNKFVFVFVCGVCAGIGYGLGEEAGFKNGVKVTRKAMISAIHDTMEEIRNSRLATSVVVNIKKMN